MTPYAFGRYLGKRLREKQAIGFGDIGKGFQNTGAATGTYKPPVGGIK